MMLSKNSTRHFLLVFDRRYRCQQINRNSFHGFSKVFRVQEKSVKDSTYLRTNRYESKSIPSKSFSSHPSIAQQSPSSDEEQPLVEKELDKPIRWRFREEGPIDVNEVIRVLFAGPHFHAALPSLQAELDRRRKLEGDNADKKYPNIILVHAPTSSDLWKEAPAAHIAIPFMEAFPGDFFVPEITPKLRLVVQFGVGLEGVDLASAHLKELLSQMSLLSTLETPRQRPSMHYTWLLHSCETFQLRTTSRVFRIDPWADCCFQEPFIARRPRLWGMEQLALVWLDI